MAHLLEKTRKSTSILKRSEEQLRKNCPTKCDYRQLANIGWQRCIVNSKGRLSLVIL